MLRALLLLFIILQLDFISGYSQDTLDRKAPLPVLNSMKFSMHSNYKPVDNFRGEAGIITRATINSNAITIPFSFAIIGNDFIDNDKKDDVSAKLIKQNTLEYTYDIEVYGRWLADTFLFHTPSICEVSYHRNNFIAAEFPEPVFNTIFYGNAYYAGQMADYSKTRSLSYECHQIGFSIRKRIEEGKQNHELGAGVSLMSVNSGSMFVMPTGSLFTAETGEYLDAIYDYEYVNSKKSDRENIALGALIDVHYSIQNQDESSRLTFFVNDFGIASYHNRSHIYTADSAIHFEGIEVANLLSSDDSSLIQYSLDSLLENTGATLDTAAKSFMLPVSFSVLYQKSLNAALQISGGISYRPFPDLFPLVFVKSEWYLRNQFNVAAILSGGGTSLYAVGFEAGKTFGKNVNVHLGTANILGLILPHQTTSASLFLQARCFF